MRENKYVIGKWRSFKAAAFFDIAVPTVALAFLTVAPVANPEWPYLLAGLWGFYLLCLTCELRHYFHIRSIYLALRFEETPEWVKTVEGLK